MIILENERSVAFDCDDTLVMWGPKYLRDDNPVVHLTDPRRGCIYSLTPHRKHIQKLKGYKRSGYKIIVWSAGGWEWAKTVVETLGLVEYVDLVMAKPDYCYDDLPLDIAIGARKYYSAPLKKGDSDENL